MKKVQEWFAEYSITHQHPLNKKLHFIAVPLIYLSVFGLLWQVPMPLPQLEAEQITWPLLLAIPVLLFYLNLSRLLGVGMTIFTAFVVLFIRWFESEFQTNLALASFGLFALGWILQFIGHAIEGKKLAFFKDLQFLLVGPVWILGYLLNKCGIRY